MLLGRARAGWDVCERESEVKRGVCERENAGAESLNRL